MSLTMKSFFFKAKRYNHYSKIFFYKQKHTYNTSCTVNIFIIFLAYYYNKAREDILFTPDIYANS